jgi:hypothetical protein
VLRLTTLKRLSASVQPITKIPAEIGNLTELNYLAFCECPIAWVPQSVRRLTQLESVWIGAQTECSSLTALKLVNEAADLCRWDEARRTCRAFVWARKNADAPYCRMPKEIARMICEALLEMAKQDAMREGPLFAPRVSEFDGLDTN